MGNKYLVQVGRGLTARRRGSSAAAPGSLRRCRPGTSCKAASARRWSPVAWEALQKYAWGHHQTIRRTTDYSILGSTLGSPYAGKLQNCKVAVELRRFGAFSCGAARSAGRQLAGRSGF